MEEDEWREKVENLDKLCENYRNMALNTEPGSESSDDMDYWDNASAKIIIN